ncbi:family 16 glycoside hydrolase [Nocardioides sp. TF02-7]|uniref:family 16 glycoside hydrolase n=1 Tax=Nocardioides sp. TF02-7 TaxID=2917724 RepID=UPI0023DBFC65|nr:family 16 glycoside hydrolase [Nocardioides sp. TF02-7]
MAEGGSFARQDDCSIKSVGAFGLLWHTEPIDHDYSLKLDWMMPGDDNSGVFVGFPDPQGSAWSAVDHGHEIQIDPSDDADSTTGAIYNFQAADAEARDAVLRPAGGVEQLRDRGRGRPDPRLPQWDADQRLHRHRPQPDEPALPRGPADPR